MQADIKKTLKAPWDRITNLDLEKLPLLSAGEQTKLSWAKEIDSYAKIPEIYQDYYVALLEGGTSFPYTVITPTFNGFIHRENEKLICSQDKKIFILENANNQLNTSCYAIEDINYVEVGTILLKAWIRISGLADNGVLSSAILRFNSVTEYMFHPFIDQIRSAENNISSIVNGSELTNFDYLSEINFKFMNYARKSIMPGEQVIEHVFQPEIRTNFFTLFRKKFYRTMFAAHIAILTDKELIIIQDTDSGSVNKSKRYGGLRYYIPLENLCSVSLTTKDEHLLELSITLSADEHIDTFFSVSKKPQIDRLLKKLNGLVPEVIISQN